MSLESLNISIYGSSLVSSYCNGAASYYRGLLKYLHARGHQITFYEPDAFGRQQHRDISNPDYARVVVYNPTPANIRQSVQAAAQNADVILKASGVGIYDDLLETSILNMRKETSLAVFWDIDTATTLKDIKQDQHNPLLKKLPAFDLVITYAGGEPIVQEYHALGIKRCITLYAALDPDIHYPVEKSGRYVCDLAFLGNRLPDRESQVEEFFFKPALLLPTRTFILGGVGWNPKELPRNVFYASHVSPLEYNAFNSSPMAVLNIRRTKTARNGFAPAPHLFEAAGANACIITDTWKGAEEFLRRDKEVLVADSGENVAEILSGLSYWKAKEIGHNAGNRIRDQHTYLKRAMQLEKILMDHLNEVTIKRKNHAAC